jgi:hypothetical protein
VNIKDAKALAFGSKPSENLEEYYGAWQWLYDNHVYLNVADAGYMDKLICDGHITIETNG